MFPEALKAVYPIIGVGILCLIIILSSFYSEKFLNKFMVTNIVYIRLGVFCLIGLILVISDLL